MLDDDMRLKKILFQFLLKLLTPPKFKFSLCQIDFLLLLLFNKAYFKLEIFQLESIIIKKDLLSSYQSDVFNFILKILKETFNFIYMDLMIF